MFGKILLNALLGHRPNQPAAGAARPERNWLTRLLHTLTHRGRIDHIFHVSGLSERE